MKTWALVLTLLSALIALAVSPSTAQIWQWVDRDGVLTFSNSKPPVDARDAELIASTEAEHRTEPPVEILHPDSAATAQDAETAWPADGEIPIADLAANEAYEPWAYDCCLRYVQPDPAYNVYRPFSDYADTRRYPHGPYRRGRGHLRPPDFRRHLSHHRRSDPFGFRRYDREYFSSSYRYRSRAPRYHRYGHAPDGRRTFGAKRYGGREGSRAYRGGRFHRGPRIGAGRMRGYRGGAGVRGRH